MLTQSIKSTTSKRRHLIDQKETTKLRHCLPTLKQAKDKKWNFLRLLLWYLQNNHGKVSNFSKEDDSLKIKKINK